MYTGAKRLLDNDKEKIKSATNKLEVCELADIILFLEILKENANFANGNDLITTDFMSDHIPIGTFSEQSLQRNVVKRIVDWLSTNTPIHKLIPPKTRLASGKLSIYVSANDIDVIRELIQFLGDIKDKKKNRLEYNLEKGILHFQGKEIRIVKKKDTKTGWLMKLLFSEEYFGEKLYTGELVEEDIGTSDKSHPRVAEYIQKRTYYYNLAKSINTKIYEEVGINDFIIASTKFLYINPKYIDKMS